MPGSPNILSEGHTS